MPGNNTSTIGLGYKITSENKAMCFSRHNAAVTDKCNFSFRGNLFLLKLQMNRVHYRMNDYFWILFFHLIPIVILTSHWYHCPSNFIVHISGSLFTEDLTLPALKGSISQVHCLSIYQLSSHLIIYCLIHEGRRDVTTLSPIFQGVTTVTGANPSYLSEQRQGTPWTSRQLIAGPLLMAKATTQGANCTSGAILGFSVLLKDTSTCSSVLPQGSQDSNQQPSNH